MNKFDSIEKLIFELGLRIKSMEINKKQDEINVVLNTGACLSLQISDYTLLSSGTQAQMMNYELIADGVGLHWPDLDEDLSLKGFYKNRVFCRNPTRL